MTDSAQQLETLKSIFPDIEPEVCQLVLENNQHQLEQAIEQLLNFSDPSQQTQPVSNCPDTSNDEELARQLAASEQAHEEDLNSNLNEPPLINVVSESAGEPTSETHSVLTKRKSPLTFVLNLFSYYSKIKLGKTKRKHRNEAGGCA